MKLQRRDLFRATVAGLATKVIGPAHATRVVDSLVAARDLAGALGVRMYTINEQVHFAFDALFSREVR